MIYKLILILDKANLAGNFVVWAASPEADFLKGRFVWSNWDVVELIQRKDEILQKDLLCLDLRGI